MNEEGATRRTGGNKQRLDLPTTVVSPALHFRRTPLDNPWIAVALGIGLTALLVMLLRIWMRA